MPDTPEATSPASAAPADKGDGKKGANVNASQLIARFMTNDEKRSNPPTADTAATPTENSPSAAEPVQKTSSSEATSNSTGETSAETGTQAQTAEEGEADSVLSPETSSHLDPKTKEKIQKRIDREVGKRKALEGQLEQLKAQIESLSKTQEQAPTAAQTAAASEPSVVPITQAPLPDIKNMNALQEYKTLAKHTVRAAEAALDRDDIDWTAEGGVVIPEFGEEPVTKARLKTVLRNARIALEDTIPAQAEYFQQQNQIADARNRFTQTAHQKFPYLAEKDSPERRQADQILAQTPWLKQLPASEWFLGAYIKGLKALMAEESAASASKGSAEVNGKGKSAPEKPAARQTPPSDQSAVSTSGRVLRQAPDAASESAFQTEWQRFRSRGNATAESAAQILEKRELARRRG